MADVGKATTEILNYLYELVHRKIGFIGNDTMAVGSYKAISEFN